MHLPNKKAVYSSVCIIFSLGLIILFTFLGQFLIVTEPPIVSDAIILLTGGGKERPELAISLYEAGFAPIIIISNALEDGIYDSVIQQVPLNDVIAEKKADSTYNNAVYTLKIMKEMKFKSAIVVSSDYHMRRVKFDFSDVFAGSGIRLIYCAAQTNYNLKYWFANKHDLNITFYEYTKMVGNAIGFNGTNDKQLFEKIKRFFGF
jgi:hypothetical protein